jgi:hypothetical protein
MTLAWYGGAFREVYTTDLDRSFTDAVFTGERLYVRNLMTSDSSRVYEDTTVIRLAQLYARTTPGAQPLGSNDEAPSDPSVTATGETDVLDVRGPYVLIEHRSSVEHGGVEEQEDTIHVTVDLRTGRAAAPEKIARDPASRDTTAVVSLPYRRHRAAYDLLVNGDSAQGAVSFLLRDNLQRSWPILTTVGAPRIYWLDTPPLDAKVRNALLRAFNSAATYNEAVKYVRYVAPRERVPFHSVSFRRSL